EVLSGVTTLGGTDKLAHSQRGRELPSHPELLKQTLVWSPGNVNSDEAIQRASDVYDAFTASAGDKAMICLGSVKSNPTVELVIADTFQAQPFESQDDCERASDRRCPFFLRYRDSDPHLPSASAGTRLSRTEAATEPGIYYEQADGSWG